MGHRNLAILVGIICLLKTLAQGQLLEDETIVENAIHLQNLANEPELNSQTESVRRNLQRIPMTMGTGQTLRPASNMDYSTFGLIVYHEFPSTFIRSQIFQIRGRITSAAASNGTYVSFNLINIANPKLKFSYLITVAAGTSEWKINLDTRNVIVSDYNIAFYTGLTGSYNPANIYRVRSPGTENNRIAPPSIPSGCSLALLNNKLILSWIEDRTTPIQKISFNQNGNTLEYFLSNFQSTFEIPHKDFASFANGNVTIAISSAYSTLNGLSGRFSPFSIPWNYTFIAGPHNFSQMTPQITLTQPIPWTVNVGTTINIQGSANVAIYNGMKVQEPQNVVATYNLSTINILTLSAGTTFTRSLTLSKPGVYIVEINAITGLAVLNRPIYVGTGIPLLPDFVDFLPLSYDSTSLNAVINSQPQTIEAFRSSLLSMINHKRKLWGRPLLTLDAPLTSLAQSHSNDMMTRNFFGHVTPNGLGPQDRAQRANLTYGIGENVAKNIDLREGHERLCRSPGHLENIVNPNFTRVGLGISRDSRGYLLITENYAGPLPVSNTSPVSSSGTTGNLASFQIEGLRIQVRDWIRTGYPTAIEDPILSKIVISWLALNTTESIFPYTWNVGKYSAMMLSASTLVAPFSTTFTRSFIAGSHLKQPDSSYTRFGVGIIQQGDGKIRVVAEYAK